jgi:hypothetical protein
MHRTIIAFMILLVASVGCIGQDEAAIRETLRKYEETYNTRDVAGFQSVMAANLSQSDIEALFQYFDLLEMKIHISQINSISINGTAALVNLTIEYGMADLNNTIIQNIELIKTEGKWKIAMT